MRRRQGEERERGEEERRRHYILHVRMSSGVVKVTDAVAPQSDNAILFQYSLGFFVKLRQIKPMRCMVVG